MSQSYPYLEQVSVQSTLKAGGAHNIKVKSYLRGYRQSASSIFYHEYFKKHMTKGSLEAKLSKSERRCEGEKNKCLFLKKIITKTQNSTEDWKTVRLL